MMEKTIMGKMLTLLFITLLTLGFMTGYLFLTRQIIVGSLKIAAGQKQLAEGEQMLAQGKAKLSNGQQQLSRAKSGYNEIKTASYAGMAMLPIVGVIAMASN